MADLIPYISICRVMCLYLIAIRLYLIAVSLYLIAKYLYIIR